MANLTVLDTGYPNTTNNGTQLSTANRANSGNAIELKAAEATFDASAGLDNTPIPAKYFDTDVNTTASQVTFASVENPKITISGVLKRNSETDMNLIPELYKLVTTKGIKVLYYNSTSDGYRDLTDSLGSTDSYHVTGTKHLHIRVKNFSIRHTSDKMLLRYTLTCEIVGLVSTT